MGLASLGLDIDIFCDFLYIFLRLSVILGLGCLGLVLSRPQVQLHRRPARQEHAMWRPGALLEEGVLPGQGLQQQCVVLRHTKSF
jgi:hypothetical protein